MELYRGKDKRSGEWIVGAVICIGEKAYVLASQDIFPERPAYRPVTIGFEVDMESASCDGYKGAKVGWKEALERYEDNFPLWLELEPETVTRCCEKHDLAENVLFEGDIYENPDGLQFEICYGKYMAFCPGDKEWMENVGFFVVSKDAEDLYGVKEAMPLGSTEEYAVLIGNIFDNPELSYANRTAGQYADQTTIRTLMPGT